MSARSSFAALAQQTDRLMLSTSFPTQQSEERVSASTYMLNLSICHLSARAVFKCVCAYGEFYSLFSFCSRLGEEWRTTVITTKMVTSFQVQKIFQFRFLLHD